MAMEADIVLCRDIGIHAGQEAMRAFVAALDRLPDEQHKFAASAVGAAFIQHKLDGIRKVGGPKYELAMQLVTMLFAASDPPPMPDEEKEGG